MKIDRAIENLTRGRKDCGMIPSEEYTRTIDMAIAALKAVKRERESLSFHATSLLKGETKK